MSEEIIYVCPLSVLILRGWLDLVKHKCVHSRRRLMAVDTSLASVSGRVAVLAVS